MPYLCQHPLPPTFSTSRLILLSPAMSRPICRQRLHHRPPSSLIVYVVIRGCQRYVYSFLTYARLLFSHHSAYSSPRHPHNCYVHTTIPPLHSDLCTLLAH